MEVKVPVLEKATCEQYLAWFETVTTVLNGLGTTAPTAKFNIIEQLCKGYLKEKFCAAREKLIAEIARRAGATPAVKPLEPDEQYNYVVQDMTKAIFPKKAVMLQKHYMQYYMRKTQDVTVLEYRARVARLMSLLKSFPPFGPNQSFNEDEHKSLVYFNFPNIYTDELTLQGFDFTEGSIDDLYKALERIEPSANATLNAGSKSKRHDKRSKEPNKKKSRKGNQNSDNNNSKNDKKFFCKLHKHNNTHDTNNCFTLGNKKKNNDETKTFTKKKLNSYVKKQAKKHIKAALNKNVKQLKSTSDDEEAKMDHFNYEQNEESKNEDPTPFDSDEDTDSDDEFEL